MNFYLQFQIIIIRIVSLSDRNWSNEINWKMEEKGKHILRLPNFLSTSNFMSVNDLRYKVETWNRGAVYQHIHNIYVYLISTQ